MAGEYGFEAWTLPTTGSFTRKSHLTRWLQRWTVTDRYSDLSTGTLAVSEDFPQLATLLKVDPANRANDEGSVIRVTQNGDPVMHFVVSTVEDTWDDKQPTVKVGLQGMEHLLDRARILPYDYASGAPTRDPDWIYGAESVLRAIGGEESNELQEIWLGGTTGTFTITDGTDTTDPISVGASAGAIRTRLETDLAGITSVSVRGDGQLKTPYEIEFINPNAYTQLTIGTNSTDGNISVSTTREGGSQSERPWHKSYNPVTQIEHGNYQAFQVVTTPVPTGDTYSLEVDADSVNWAEDYAGAQQIVNVVPGRTYRASVPVYCNQATNFRLVLRDMNEGEIAKSPDTLVPAGVWTTLTIDPFVMPDGIDQMIFRVGILETTNIPAVYIGIESALFAPGFPAATLGKILNDLLDPVTTRGVLDWITPTWTDTLDSAGNSWIREESRGVKRGQSFLQLLEYEDRWGYEWRIRWDDAQSRFEWDVFNPNAGGSDLSASVAITGRDGSVSSGPIVTRMPGVTYAVAEGESGAWGESENATLSTAWGRLEGYFGNKQGHANLASLASQLVAKEATDSQGRRIRLSEPNRLPWTDYQPGDIINLNLAPKDVKQDLRVAGVTVAQTGQDSVPSYDVHLASMTFDPETAQTEAVRGLIRKFQGLENVPQDERTVDPIVFGAGGGGGGVSGFTVRVAANNASAASKAAADYICDGTADQDEIQQACTDVQSSPNGGRVVLSEGNFTLTGSVVVYNLTHVQGMGMGSTFVTFNADNTGFGATNGDGNEFSDFAVGTNQAPNTASAGIYITNGTARVNRIWFTGWWDTAVYVQGTECVVTDNLFQLGTGGDVAVRVESNADRTIVARNVFDQGGDTSAQLLVEADQTVIANNVFENSRGDAIHVGANSSFPSYPTITGNQFRAESGRSIYMQNTSYFAVVGNTTGFPSGLVFEIDTCNDGIISGNNWQGNFTLCELDGCARVTVANNMFGFSGLQVNGGSDITTVANQLVYSRSHAIEYNGVTRGGIKDNTANPLAQAASPADGILITGGTSDLHVTGNTLTPDVDGTSSRYGINVATAACADNVVVGNDLRPGSDWGSDALNDAGSGTVLTFPSDVTYGDNFTGDTGAAAGGAPDTFTAGISLPQATALGGAASPTVTPDPVSVAVSLPQATPDTAGDAIAYPNPTQVTVSLPTATVVIT